MSDKRTFIDVILKMLILINGSDKIKLSKQRVIFNDLNKSCNQLTREKNECTLTIIEIDTKEYKNMNILYYLEPMLVKG